jgi:hypothetical protein
MMRTQAPRAPRSMSRQLMLLFLPVTLKTRWHGSAD